MTTAKAAGFKLQTSSLRAYTMIVALVLIWIFFHYATSPNTPDFWDFAGHLRYFFGFDWLSTGIFLGSRNLSNLTLQTSVTGILAVGMLMIIVAGQIDLSVGSVLGLAGGVAAISMAQGYGLGVSIVAAVAVGVAIGIIQGSLTAYLNIPAFIVTLGGLLAWRGAVKFVTKSETVPVADATFKSIGQSYIPSNVGWILAGIAILAVLLMTFKNIKTSKEFDETGASNPTTEILKSLLPIAAIVIFIYEMNAYAGVPIPVLILLAVALLGYFITNNTTFGRYLYAIGGNADAARLSGINNKINILKVFALLGALTGIASIIFTARVGSASPDAGTLKELDAIAACVIGGASLVGGRGTIFGACLGALIMASLDNGMSLLNVRDFMQEIIKGSILVAAVGLDMAGKKQS